MSKHDRTEIVEREGGLWTASCPELDVVSQGATSDEATANLREAIDGLLAAADAAEIAHRLASRASRQATP